MIYKVGVFLCLLFGILATWFDDDDTKTFILDLIMIVVAVIIAFIGCLIVE